MGLFSKLFGSRKALPKSIIDRLDINEVEKESITNFIVLSDDERIKQIMFKGDSGDLEHYKLLKYALLFDNNLNVKFASLKRMHLFKAEPDCANMLTELKNSNNVEDLEPYFSMALSRIGIISLQDFKDSLNK